MQETNGVRVTAALKGMQVVVDVGVIQREIEMSCDGLSVRHLAISKTPSLRG